MAFGGIVLAAGFSSRMSGFKPLLPIGGQPAIVRAVCSLLEADVDCVRVVVGHRAPELLPVLRHLPVVVVENPHHASGMFSSVAAGVRSYGKDEVQGFFMLPADIPLVSPQTVRKVASALTPSTLVVYPVYKGKRGHPPLISSSLSEMVLGWNAAGGMRMLLRQVEEDAPERITCVPVDDPAVLLDMDTPKDYRLILRYWDWRRKHTHTAAGENCLLEGVVVPMDCQQNIWCSVSNCHYWTKGNKCVAERILITSNEMARTLPPAIDSPYAGQMPGTPVPACVDSCCKTFVSKGDFESFEDGVNRKQP